MKARTVLIICEFFPPCRDMTSSSKRLEGFTRYLSSFGWNPIILNHQCSCVNGVALAEQQPWADSFFLHENDSIQNLHEALSMRNESRPLIIRISSKEKKIINLRLRLAALTNPRFEVDNHFGRACAVDSKCISFLPLRALLSVFRKLLSWISTFYWDQTDWPERATRIAKAVCGELKEIDLIFSTSPNVVNHVIACRVSKAMRLLWIADIRDSIIRSCADASHFTGSIKYGFLKKASALVHVTPEEAERDKHFFTKQSYVIENGFIDDELKRAKGSANHSNGVFVMRYLGVVDAFSQLDTFLKGFALFLKLTRVTQSNLKFQYYGQTWKKVQNLVDRLELQQFCEVHPTVSRDRAMELMITATVLVQPIDSRYPGCPGAKFYEYVGSERPILATGGQEVYVESILKKTGCGIPAHSVEEVCKALQLWYSNYLRDGDVLLNYNKNEIMRFSRQNLTKKLADVFEALI